MDSRVFLDASFWIAYRDFRERDYQRAEELVRQLLKERKHFVTTLLVFCEIHARFARNARRRNMVIGDFWNNPLVHFEQPTPEDLKNSLSLLDEHQDKDYSFCDAVSFVIMRRMGLRQAASFDDHFRQIGEFEIIS